MTNTARATALSARAAKVSHAIELENRHAARKWAYNVKGVPEGKAQILVADGNFAGRTTTIIGFSSEAQYRDGFGPFAPGFVTAPFGDAKALETAITSNTAAFIVEPIQGE